MQENKQKYLWVILGAAFVLFMVKLDAFVVNVSLPTIGHAFSLNAAQASLIIVVYLLMLTNTLLIFGKLEDRLGVKKLLFSGYLLFTAGSLFCGLAPTFGWLVLARALQGVGGAILLICGFGAVNNFLPEEIKGWALGIVTTAAALGIATGAPLGGYITHYLNWRWIFFINVPLGIIGLLMSSKTLPQEKINQAIASQPFDFWGAILSFCGLSGLTYVLSIGGQAGWLSMQTISLFLGSLATLSIFVYWQTKCKYPLVELRIFRNHGFTYANLAVFMIFMILAGADFIIPFFLQLAKALNPYQAGLLMFLYSAMYSVIAPYAGRLLDKPGFRFLNLTSLLAAALLFLAYAYLLPSAALIITVIFLSLWGVANAFLVTENFRLVFTHIPADEKGVGAGVFNVANNLSMVFGVCAFQILFSHMTRLADLPDPSSLVNSGEQLAIYFVAFRSIFIFAGLLYLLAALFSYLAEKAIK